MDIYTSAPSYANIEKSEHSAPWRLLTEGHCGVLRLIGIEELAGDLACLGEEDA